MDLHKLALKGALPVKVPSTLNAFENVELLTKVLRSNKIIGGGDSVVGVERNSMGVPGFVSAVCRLTLRYSEGVSSSAPATMIAKVSGGDLAEEKKQELIKEGKTDEASSMAKETGLQKHIMHTLFYPNEIRFYAETDPSKTDARFPKCFFTASRDTTHAMLLEDLSFATFGDIRNALTLEDCLKVMVWLAKFHQGFWGLRDRKGASPGVPSQVQQLVIGNDSGLWPLVLKAEDKPQQDVFEALLPDDFKRSEKLLKFLGKRWKSLAKALRNPTHSTLVHGDAHAENFVYHEGEAIGIDFGNVGWANPMVDVSYFLVKAIANTENRRAWTEELLLTYHRALTSGPRAVQGYDLPQMRKDLKLFSITPFLCFLAHLKLVREDVKAKKGYFAPDLADPYLIAYRDVFIAGMKDAVTLCEDQEVLETLTAELTSTDPCWPGIPCCCCWSI